MPETPYERGYTSGQHLGEMSQDDLAIAQAEESYFQNLSEKEKKEYDLGFYDALNGRPISTSLPRQKGQEE